MFGLFSATPAAVPVEIISPGSNVIDLLSIEMIDGIFMNIFDVVESCLIWPLIFVVSLRFWGSSISSLVVIHGPHGANPSNDFARVNCLSMAWMSLADTSLSIIYPKITSIASSSEIFLHFLPSISEINRHSNRLDTEIAKLENDTDNTNNVAKELEQIKEDLKLVNVEKNKAVEEKKYIDIAREILNDTGVKANIIKKYLPIMNNLINKYLQSMDFFVNFELDEEFNETIKSRFRDTFNYNSFSEGEKLRIDLALLFTWRTIAKMKNSTNTNLLILDEIFDSSLDGQGTEDFFKILKTLTNENTFIISHKGDILFDKFTNIIKFEKYKNFTRIAAWYTNYYHLMMKESYQV